MATKSAKAHESSQRLHDNEDSYAIRKAINRTITKTVLLYEGRHTPRKRTYTSIGSEVKSFTFWRKEDSTFVATEHSI